MYLKEPKKWYICGVALFTERRGKGIGKRLIHYTGQALLMVADI